MEVRQVRTAEIKQVLLDDPAANIRYIGRCSSLRGATSDPLWQIYREYKNGSVTTTTYANMGEFNCIWDSRTTYFPAATANDDNPLGGITPIDAGVGYDTITATYPTATSEVYTYTLAAVTVKVLTVTYVDSTKEQILTVVRS